MENTAIFGTYARSAQSYSASALEGALFIGAALAAAEKINGALKSYFKGAMIGRLETPALPVAAVIIATTGFMVKKDLIPSARYQHITALTIGALACSYYKKYRDHIGCVQEMKKLLSPDTALSKKLLKVEIEGYPDTDVLVISNPQERDLVIPTEKSFVHSNKKVFFISGYKVESDKLFHPRLLENYSQALVKGGALSPTLRPCLVTIPSSCNLANLIPQDPAILKDLDVIHAHPLTNTQSYITVNNRRYVVWIIKNLSQELARAVIADKKGREKCVPLSNASNMVICRSPPGYSSMSDKEFDDFRRIITEWYKEEFCISPSIVFIGKQETFLRAFSVRHHPSVPSPAITKR